MLKVNQLQRSRMMTAVAMMTIQRKAKRSRGYANLAEETFLAISHFMPDTSAYD